MENDIECSNVSTIIIEFPRITTMNHNSRVSWIKWKFSYMFNRKGYFTRFNRNIWGEIGSHKLDQLVDQLAQLYLFASAEEKNIIDSYIRKKDQLSWELVLYVRRAALRVQNNKDDRLIYWALVIALLASKSDDPRDVLNSLLLLKIGAEKAGIDIKTWYEKVSPNALSNLQSIFYTVENQPEKSIATAVNKFGPPEWKSVSSQ
jgi:hypothetical protein